MKTIHDKKAELAQQRRERAQEIELAKKAGEYWEYYGAVTRDNGTVPSTRAFLCLRNRAWAQPDMDAFDSQHAGANLIVGPVAVLGKKGDAISQTAQALNVDEVTVRVLA